MEVRIPRQQKRVSIPLSIELDAGAANGGARISDLSMGGCYVDSIFNVRQDENVRFRLALPTGRSVDLNGDVVYVHDGIGFGLRFTRLSDHQRLMLQKVILLSGGTL